MGFPPFIPAEILDKPPQLLSETRAGTGKGKLICGVSPDHRPTIYCHFVM